MHYSWINLFVKLSCIFKSTVDLKMQLCGVVENSAKYKRKFKYFSYI